MIIKKEKKGQFFLLIVHCAHFTNCFLLIVHCAHFTKIAYSQLLKRIILKFNSSSIAVLTM